MDKILLDYLPMVATLFLTLCYVPQIVYIFKTKDVSSMSLAFWVMLNIAILLLTINALVIFIKFGTYGYLITEVLNGGLALAVLILVLKYRKK